ncbi:MAG: hypothetical protein AB7E52_05425 [Bdellovibrionales bacterium]
MPSASRLSAEEKAVVLAAFNLTAKRGFAAATPQALADETGLPLAKVKKIADTPESLIPACVRTIDALTIAATQSHDPQLPLTDCLFDMMMNRFDALQKYREAILIISDECRHRPSLALAMCRAQLRSMALLSHHLYGVQCNKDDRITKPILLVIYNYVFLKWAQDTSPDLSATMAGLNKIIQTNFVRSVLKA